MSARVTLGWVAARLTYPGLIVCALLAAHQLRLLGVSAGLTSSALFLGVLVAAALLEQRFPHRPSWRPGADAARQDLAYLALTGLLQPAGKLLGLGLTTGVSLALARAASERNALSALPTWATALLALLAADLGKYWLHRAAHERPWFWRFHAEHHSPHRMNVLNATRLHPVNLIWNLALDAAAPALLGLGLDAALYVVVFRGTVSVLQHANVRLELGPLNWILSTPTLHQWHHSAALHEANANYGSTFIVWDIVFGTRHLPRARQAPVTLGLADGGPHPSALRHQLVWPWCAARATTCPRLRSWTPLEDPRKEAMEAT